MEAFSWLGQIIEALGRLVPRLLIIRATHGGVRWLFGRYVKALSPGIHVYWPIITDVEVFVVARQTLNLPTQVLMTRDQREIVVGTLVVYRIKDVVLAAGQRNWDIDSTVADIAQAAVVEVIANSELPALQAGVAGDIEKMLTLTTRKRLRQFGVYVHRCAITDLSTCRTLKLIGGLPGSGS